MSYAFAFVSASALAMRLLQPAGRRRALRSFRVSGASCTNFARSSNQCTLLCTPTFCRSAQRANRIAQINVCQSKCIKQNLSVRWCQPESAGQSVPIKACQSECASQHLPVRVCQSECANQPATYALPQLPVVNVGVPQSSAYIKRGAGAASRPFSLSYLNSIELQRKAAPSPTILSSLKLS